jgi:hypothetical protein
MLAADETKHAALAWKTLAWILPQTDASFRARLVRDADTLAERAFASSASEPRAAAADAWREIILPTLRALASA